MISSAQFRVTEYEGAMVGMPDEIHPIYRSRPMCLRDASRFAAALSYARGAYIRVEPDTPGETYREWWLAGTIWREADVPPICGDLGANSLEPKRRIPPPPVAMPEENWRPLPLREAVRIHVNRVLDLCEGNVRKAAGMLGIGRTSVYRFLMREKDASQNEGAT